MKKMRVPADRGMVFGIILVLFAAILIFVFMWWRARESQGESNANCEQFPLSVASNGTGWEISGHMTGCSPPAASLAGYIYIHPVNEKESLKYMAFRYLDSSRGDEPAYKWLDEKTVLISIKSVERVTRLRYAIGSIKIKYNIGSEIYPRLE